MIELGTRTSAYYILTSASSRRGMSDITSVHSAPSPLVESAVATHTPPCRTPSADSRPPTPPRHTASTAALASHPPLRHSSYTSPAPAHDVPAHIDEY